MSKRVMITMVVLMCCALSTRAQWPMVNEKLNTVYDLKSKYTDAMFRVNGVLIEEGALKKTLDSIMPKDIFDITIVEASREKDPGLNVSQQETVLITTKTTAKMTYQKTLSALSPDYRNYLDANHNDDSDLQYVLNAQLLKNDSNELLYLLYKLSPEKITNVALTDVKGKKTLIIDIRFDE